MWRRWLLGREMAGEICPCQAGRRRGAGRGGGVRRRGHGLMAKHAKHADQHSQVARLCANGQVAFADGSSVAVDAIVYCTGYTYSWLSFLDQGGAVTVEDNRVGPLFQHTFLPALALSLSFVGVPMLVFVSWFLEAQEIRAFVGMYTDLPDMEDWKMELFSTAFGNMNDDRETFQDFDDYIFLANDGQLPIGDITNMSGRRKRQIHTELVLHNVDHGSTRANMVDALASEGAEELFVFNRTLLS
ncbi:flavin-containing monooxygenase FMO GS-OX-like 8 [Panicum miliaceum]|uniref:Flavin-containing monooxygenase FMO GS-OX-like 8 n=1 Tax=Panicum miliaceum TaxID=4540 RepID=A0A3L6TJJ9_PANMI|nr:flavin-containing monooxygenase FMO GS-OX-like 8 [Panicum miliaceum]